MDECTFICLTKENLSKAFHEIENRHLVNIRQTNPFYQCLISNLKSKYPEMVIRNIDFESYQLNKTVYKRGDYDQKIYINYKGEFILEAKPSEDDNQVKKNRLLSKSITSVKKFNSEQPRKTMAIIPLYETIGEYEVMHNLPRSFNLICKSNDGMLINFDKKFANDYLLNEKELRNYLETLANHKIENYISNYEQNCQTLIDLNEKIKIYQYEHKSDLTIVNPNGICNNKQEEIDKLRKFSLAKLRRSLKGQIKKNFKEPENFDAIGKIEKKKDWRYEKSPIKSDTMKEPVLDTTKFEREMVQSAQKDKEFKKYLYIAENFREHPFMRVYNVNTNFNRLDKLMNDKNTDSFLKLNDTSLKNSVNIQSSVQSPQKNSNVLTEDKKKSFSLYESETAIQKSIKRFNNINDSIGDQSNIKISAFDNSIPTTIYKSEHHSNVHKNGDEDSNFDDLQIRKRDSQRQMNIDDSTNGELKSPVVNGKNSIKGYRNRTKLFDKLSCSVPYISFGNLQNKIAESQKNKIKQFQEEKRSISLTRDDSLILNQKHNRSKIKPYFEDNTASNLYGKSHSIDKQSLYTANPPRQNNLMALREPEVLIKSSYDKGEYQHYASYNNLGVFNPNKRIEKVNESLAGNPNEKEDSQISCKKKTGFGLPNIKQRLLGHRNTNSEGNMGIFVKKHLSELNLSSMNKMSKKNIVLNLKKAKRLKDKIMYQKDKILYQNDYLNKI